LRDAWAGLDDIKERGVEDGTRNPTFPVARVRWCAVRRRCWR